MGKPIDVPTLVLGAENDRSVDWQGLKETGDYYGVEPILIENMAHDMMLVSTSFISLAIVATS